VKKYQEVRKSLQNLVKGQERNMAQLEKIKAIVEQRWGSKKGLQSYRKKSEVEEDRNDEEGSEDGPRESQEERTLLSVSY